MTDWRQYSASITVAPPAWPETVTPPHDRRHRWKMTSQQHDARGWPRRAWFRCTACGRRRSVTYLVSLLGDKMQKAQASLRERLTQMVFAP